MIFYITINELRKLFLSPLAWTLLAVMQGLLAWIFLILVNDFREAQSGLAVLESAPGVTDLVAAPLLRVSAWGLLIVTPLLTMNLFSEERRTRTLDLLLSAPVSVSLIVLGKYLAVMTFLLGITLLTLTMPLVLSMGAALDFGKLLAGWLGLILLASSFTAMGLYISMLTTQPLVAAVVTLGLLLLLSMIDIQSSSGKAGSLLSYLSLLGHYDALLRGLFNSADIVYYLLLDLTFLSLAIRRLDDERLRD